MPSESQRPTSAHLAVFTVKEISRRKSQFVDRDNSEVQRGVQKLVARLVSAGRRIKSAKEAADGRANRYSLRNGNPGGEMIGRLGHGGLRPPW